VHQVRLHPTMSERVAAVVLTALLLVAPSAAQREGQHEVQSEGSHTLAPRDSTSTYVNPADVPHPCPPQPSGPQIGKTDSLMNAAAPKLSPWVKMWQASLPGFKQDSLYRVGTARALRGGNVQPLKNVYPPPPDENAVYDVLSAM